jgi:hypothetical protein
MAAMADQTADLGRPDPGEQGCPSVDRVGEARKERTPFVRRKRGPWPLSNASRAAATASAMSSAVAQGTDAKTVSFEGVTMSNRRRLAGSTHVPPIRKRPRLTRSSSSLSTDISPPAAFSLI